MTCTNPALCLALGSLALTSMPVIAQDTSPPATKAALCIPPGSKAPVACGTAKAGQTIRLQVATTDLPIDPINLLFTEQVAAGQAPRTASLTIPPDRSVDGSYDVNVPRELCGPGRQAGSFEVQRILTTFSENAVTPQSLGTLTVAC